MKKILIPILLGMLCSPVMAEDVQKMMTDMGYSEKSLFKHVPSEKFVPPPPARFEEKVVEIEPVRSGPPLSAEDFLQPRLYAKSEAPGMIPYLLKLQKQNPTSAQLTRKLAATCLRNGQPREALYWYTQTYQRDRSDLEALWNMASLAYQLGEEDLAEKYLREYADADPNSAWGRMAKEFSSGRFSGASMDKGFKSEFSRFGSAAGPAKKINYGPVRAEKKSGEGILIIEGHRTTVEQFVENYEPAVPAEPVAIKDTAKGKSGKTSVKTKKESKVNLEKPQIAAPEPKQPVTSKKTEPSDLKAVTTTAEPLGTSP